jgi:hypothetical protein
MPSAMDDAVRRIILERRAAFIAAALMVAGPCDRVTAQWNDRFGPSADPPEEPQPPPSGPKECLAVRHDAGSAPSSDSQPPG